ncbi:MAG: DUF1501 domain-containing protein [Planctomycetota bacterium]|nr:MAG: DUF1501 domain-containing protein [Planctomycetota bacterium]
MTRQQHAPEATGSTVVQQPTRRAFQQHCARAALGAGALVAGHARLPVRASSAPATAAPSPPLALPRAGRAKAVIFLWLGGGMCHVDTFDPKRLGDPVMRKPGSAYRSIPTAIAGVRVCEFLRQTADRLDRGVLLRTVSHPLSQLHAAPTNLFKTGRMISGTIVYPSIGSIVSHELGPRDPNVPPYVVMGYPNVTRGPGFLGARYGYIYLTDTESGPNGLKRPLDVDDQRLARRRRLLGVLRRGIDNQPPTSPLRQYDATISEAFRLARPEFTRVFELHREPDRLRQRYGDEFGQRCLLARRLIEAGVRFVEVSFNLNFVNGTGWDTHGEGQKNQHKLILSLDRALSALLDDLERRKRLDETLVVLATEFGRPPDFDAAGGRGHHSQAFTTALFGGGLKTAQVIGTTDDFGRRAVDRTISLPDWHATIQTALGIDPQKELYAGNRPVPITDFGQPIRELFAA